MKMLQKSNKYNKNYNSNEIIGDDIIIINNAKNAFNNIRKLRGLI